MAKAIRVGWRQPILGVVLKLCPGFLVIAVIGVWALWGFSFYIVLMPSPLVAPFVVRAAHRASAKYADRIAVDLGYGAALAEVFTGREYQRAQSWSAAPQQSLKDSQPLDSARLRALERLLKSVPHNSRQAG